MRSLILAVALLAPSTAHAEDPAVLIEAAVQSYVAADDCVAGFGPDFKTLKKTGESLLLKAALADPDAGRKFDALRTERVMWSVTNPGERIVWCAGMMQQLKESTQK